MTVFETLKGLSVTISDVDSVLACRLEAVKRLELTPVLVK